MSGTWLGRTLAELTGFAEGTPGPGEAAHGLADPLGRRDRPAVHHPVRSFLARHPLPLAGAAAGRGAQRPVNVALGARLQGDDPAPRAQRRALFAFDILQLCYLLVLTGGVQNPFAALLLLPMALAAATLEPPLDGRAHRR